MILDIKIRETDNKSVGDCNVITGGELFNEKYTMSNFQNSGQFLHILNDISKNIHALATDTWVMWGATASFLVALVALYSSNRDRINGCFWKPKIKIEETIFNTKQNLSWISRLKIENTGDEIAKGVAFIIEDLKYWNTSKNNWESANNFLPFPLSWTNTNSESRDVLLKRPYFIDLCQVIDDRMADGHRASRNIYICTPYDSPRFHGLDDLRAGKNKIKMTLYCENHKVVHSYLAVEWSGRFEAPVVRFIEKDVYDNDAE